MTCPDLSAPAGIDVFDFDGTLFAGDTQLAFTAYALRHRPRTVLFLPLGLPGLVMALLRPHDLAHAKRFFLLPLAKAHAFDLIGPFWEEMKKEGRVDLSPLGPDRPAVICSASPAFLLRPLFESVPRVVSVIGTELDPETLRILGPNNRGEEKVRRLKALFPEARIRRMLTDSAKHDAPLLALAEEPAVLPKRFRKGDVRHG